jgi:hypothetical protein
MTLRTGKRGQYRYYTCSTKARQGETGFKGQLADDLTAQERRRPPLSW